MPAPDAEERGARRARAVLRASRSMLPSPVGAGAGAVRGRSSVMVLRTCEEEEPPARRDCADSGSGGGPVPVSLVKRGGSGGLRKMCLIMLCAPMMILSR
jgi:hypothetical protein